MTPDQRIDIATRARLKALVDGLEAQGAAQQAQAVKLARGARLLVQGFAILGLMVTVALVLGGIGLSRSHRAAIAAKHLSVEQIGLRRDALVQSCEARNAQNAGIVGFLANVSRPRRPPASVAADPRVRKFFPVHGLTLPDGSVSPQTHAYCLRYADSLS